MVSGYSKLVDEPSLQPPSEAYCRSLLSSSSSSSSTSAPPLRPHAYSVASAAAASGERRGPRLFDHVPGDPTNPAALFASLENVELKGLRDEATIESQRRKLRRAAVIVCALSSVQTACAALLVLSRSSEGRADRALVLTSGLVGASGLGGLLGGWRRSRTLLHAFFLTQIVALSAIAAQWLRSQQAAAKEAVFCDERAAGTRGELEAMCGRDGATLRLGAMLLGGGVVYASMYWTDLLGEMVQDSLEQADNRRLLDFAGLMHQSTLVGIRRFEDRIHQRFEELVQLGFLKPRW